MSYVDDVLAKVIAKNPSEPEFHQAVTEVFETIRPLIEANEEEYKKQAVLERITEPERMIKFRVPEWNEEATDKFAELGTGPIEPLVLSDFTMSSNMTGMVLYEQIYRGYRILHNHPYHK